MFFDISALHHAFCFTKVQQPFRFPKREILCNCFPDPVKGIRGSKAKNYDGQAEYQQNDLTLYIRLSHVPAHRKQAKSNGKYDKQGPFSFLNRNGIQCRKGFPQHFLRQLNRYLEFWT